MQYLSLSQYQTYPRSEKKSAFMKDYENVIPYWEESKQSEVYAKKVICSKYFLMDLTFGVTPEKFAYFYSHLILDTVLLSRRLTQNDYIDISISFS